MPPDTPIYDAFAYLAYLAARTETLRLGTHVFNVGLRHPFTVARGVQTVDLLSKGRFEFGIGASWLEEEWRATGLDFATRGRRVDEIIEVCKRLWTEPTVTHHGEFFSFDEVVFEPKPVAAAAAADPRGRRVEGGVAPRRPSRRRLARHGPHLRVGRGCRSTACARSSPSTSGRARGIRRSRSSWVVRSSRAPT